MIAGLSNSSFLLRPVKSPELEAGGGGNTDKGLDDLEQ